MTNKEFDVEKFYKQLQRVSDKNADAIHDFESKCLVYYPQHAEFIQNCVTKALNDCVVCMHKHKDYQDEFLHKHPTLAALFLLASMVFWMVVVGFIYTIY